MELIWIILMSSAIHLVSTDIFTGTTTLRMLSDTENKLLKDLQTIVKLQQQKVDQLKFIADGIRSRERYDVSKVVDHPVRAYNVIKNMYILNHLFNETMKVPDETDDCYDMDVKCGIWADRGKCVTNQDIMEHKCTESCDFCDNVYSSHFFTKKFAKFKWFDWLKAKLTNQTAPSDTDTKGAAVGLIRLQRTYRLYTKHIIQGNIYRQNSINPLQVEDILLVGSQANNIGEYGYATQWLKYAWKLNVNRKLNGEIAYELSKAYNLIHDYVRANNTLTKALTEHFTDLRKQTICTDEHDDCEQRVDDRLCSKNLDQMFKECRYTCGFCNFRYPENFPGELRLVNMFHLLKKKLLNQPDISSLPEPSYVRKPVNPYVKKYERLCRGRSVRWYSNSGCKYRKVLLPWNVYKEEIYHLNPRVALIYDVITDKEAHLVKTLVRHRMQRARVGGNRTFTEKRVSKTANMDDEHHPFIKHLSQRIGMITGLEVLHKYNSSDGTEFSSSDDFQTGNYGIGGQYEPHYDFYYTKVDIKLTKVGERLQNCGDRIATFLIYLSHVHEGGATVFPVINLKVQPIKNAAVFWYNAQMSGQYDLLTIHAGCPVLLGEKWGNKWIREYGNEFKRKCRVMSDAKYTMEDYG